MSARPTNCPDCGEDLQPNAARCRCGWRLVPQVAKVNDRIAAPAIGDSHDPYCGFEHNGIRACSNLGTVKLAQVVLRPALSAVAALRGREGRPATDGVRGVEADRQGDDAKVRDHEAEAERVANQSDNRA